MKVRYSETANLKTYINIDFKEKKIKQIYPEYPGKFGIFTIIIMRIILNEKEKKNNFFRN